MRRSNSALQSPIQHNTSTERLEIALPIKRRAYFILFVGLMVADGSLRNLLLRYGPESDGPIETMIYPVAIYTSNKVKDFNTWLKLII